MSGTGRRRAWNLIGWALAIGGVASLAAARPAAGASAGLVLLATGGVRLSALHRAVQRTALRSAWAWTCAAWLAWTATQVLLLRSLASGRSGSPVDFGLALGRYWALALTGGAVVAVLGARRPGVAAWNWVVLTLVVVLLLPVVQQWAAARDQGPVLVHLDWPPAVFAGLLGAGGMINYLPTRWGFRALLIGLGYAAQTWPLVRGEPGPLVPCSVAAGLLVGTALWLAPRPGPWTPAGDPLWLWFRDRWGLVWARRVQDRFNLSARQFGWPVVLTWHGRRAAGPDAPPPTPPQQASIDQTLRGLLRRFADPGALPQGWDGAGGW